jgi:hypothetical protein
VTAAQFAIQLVALALIVLQIVPPATRDSFFTKANASNLFTTLSRSSHLLFCSFAVFVALKFALAQNQSSKKLLSLC